MLIRGMGRSRAGTWLGWMALAWCAGVSIALLVVPVYSSGATLLEDNDELLPRVALLVPVGLTALPLALSERVRGVVTILCAVVLAAFCLVTGFTIGLAYLPAVPLLTLSAWMSEASRGSDPKVSATK